MEVSKLITLIWYEFLSMEMFGFFILYHWFWFLIIQESRKSRPVDKNSAVFLTETKAETPGKNSNIHTVSID